MAIKIVFLEENKKMQAVQSTCLRQAGQVPGTK
jgi:hypothetical protein